MVWLAPPFYRTGIFKWPLRELKLGNIAEGLEQALELFRANGIYDSDWNRVRWGLSGSLREDFYAIERKIRQERDALWQADEKLAKLLQASEGK